MTSTPASLSHTPICADATTSGHHVNVANSIVACQRLREPWLELRRRMGILTPNADPDRFLAIVNALPGVRPYVVLFREGSELRALMVGRIENRALRYRIGYVPLRTPCLRCLDIVYGGMLVTDTPTDKAVVLRYIRNLLDRSSVDCLTCNHLRKDHSLAAELTVSSTTTTCEPHFVRELVPGLIDKTLARHSSAHRGKIRRYDRILCKAFGGDIVLRVFSRPDEVSEFLRQTSSIASKTYQHELGVAVEDTKLWRAILTVEASAGRMRSYVLTGGGRPIAYQNGVLYDHTYFCDGRGYDPHYRELRPGNALSHRIAADLCACGCEQIDYGFGDADYKRVYATDHWEEVTVHAYGRNSKARLAATLSTLIRAVSSALARMAACAGILRRIKNVWRRKMARDGT